MPTVRSWADLHRTEATRATADLGPLLRFRLAGLDSRSRGRVRGALLLLLTLTVAVATVPAFTPGAADSGRAESLLYLLPTAYLGLVAVAVISATAAGGGRELVPRDQAVAFPISPVTDHLGSLLMAPLNIAWILQAWLVLGASAYAFGPDRIWLSQLPILVWLVAATATGQLVAWLVEVVRRGPRGVAAVRLLVGALVAGGAVLVATGSVAAVLDRSPVVRVLIVALQGREGHGISYAVGLGTLLVVTLLLVVAGAVPARWAARRPPRDELRMETGNQRPRPTAASDLAALVRVDRVAIWRSVPLRRGLLVLAVMPGLVSLAGDLDWAMLTIMPGLVASGGALLFGVNSWCLDGRGALWRDSLPAAPGLAFASRVLVLAEVLLAAALLTVVLASLRAGLPEPHELAALVCCAVVVVLQVVAAALRWSVRRPFAADMRSARATPAPPLVMVGYSARLALTTTLVGLVFSGLARLPEWRFSLIIAVPFLLFAALSLVRTSAAWADPVQRCRVVSVVSG